MPVAEPVQESVAVEDGPNEMEAGVIKQLRLPGAETVRVTAPLYPLTGDTVIVELPLLNAMKITRPGLEPTVKSSTVT